MMNPYIEMSNGILSLPSILNAGKIRMEALPRLDNIFLLGRGVRPMPLSGMLLWEKGGHPVRADYSNKFVEQVVQVLGPGVEARMVAMRASDGKRVKVEQGTSNT